MLFFQKINILRIWNRCWFQKAAQWYSSSHSKSQKYKSLIFFCLSFEPEGDGTMLIKLIFCISALPNCNFLQFFTKHLQTVVKPEGYESIWKAQWLNTFNHSKRRLKLYGEFPSQYKYTSHKIRTHSEQGRHVSRSLKKSVPFSSSGR